MMETGKLAADTVLQNRYRILSLLKQGGMGSVYLAEGLRFRSRVAVKEAYFTQEKFRQAFAQEAGLLQQNLKLTERGDIVLLDFGLAKGAATEISQLDERMDEKSNRISNCSPGTSPGSMA